jgi:hypothetical protein
MIPGMRPLVRAILWLMHTDFGLSLLLGLASWGVLMAIDMQSPQGGLVDTAIWRLFAPVYRAGFYVGMTIFPARSASGTSLPAVSLGAAAEILVLTALWFVGIRVVRWNTLRKAERKSSPTLIGLCMGSQPLHRCRSNQAFTLRTGSMSVIGIFQQLQCLCAA